MLLSTCKVLFFLITTSLMATVAILIQSSLIVKPDWSVTFRPLLNCRVSQWDEYFYSQDPKYTGPATKHLVFVKIELVSTYDNTVLVSQTDYVTVDWSSEANEAQQLVQSLLDPENPIIRYCLIAGYTAYILYLFLHYFTLLTLCYFIGVVLFLIPGGVKTGYRITKEAIAKIGRSLRPKIKTV